VEKVTTFYCSCGGLKQGKPTRGPKTALYYNDTRPQRLFDRRSAEWRTLQNKFMLTPQCGPVISGNRYDIFGRLPGPGLDSCYNGMRVILTRNPYACPLSDLYFVYLRQLKAGKQELSSFEQGL